MNELNETASLLGAVPGGQELLEWFSRTTVENVPNFGDAEIILLHLDRAGPSTLVVKIDGPNESMLITFFLGDWIDVRLSGFSRQNVIGGLTLRSAGKREIEPWEKGVGCVPGKIEIELQPCFGANGIIRATLLSIMTSRA